MGIHVYHARMSVPVLNRTPSTRRKPPETWSSSLAPSDSLRRFARAARPRQRSLPAHRLRTRRRRNGAPARRNRGIRTQRCNRDRIARWPASLGTWSEIRAQCLRTSTSNRRRRRQGRCRQVRHAARGQSMRLSASRPDLWWQLDQRRPFLLSVVRRRSPFRPPTPSAGRPARPVRPRQPCLQGCSQSDLRYRCQPPAEPLRREWIREVQEIRHCLRAAAVARARTAVSPLSRRPKQSTTCPSGLNEEPCRGIPGSGARVPSARFQQARL